MSRFLISILFGFVLAMATSTALAASSPSLFTVRIDHQTLCRDAERDFSLRVGNGTDQPMNVLVDATHLSGQEEMPGEGLVTFSEEMFVLEAGEVHTVVATLAIPRAQKPGEYATILVFTNDTPPLSAAVGVWLRFEVLPWREGAKKCQ